MVRVRFTRAVDCPYIVDQLINAIKTGIGVSLAVFFRMVSNKDASVRELSIYPSLVDMGHAFVPYQPSNFLVRASDRSRAQIAIVM